MTLRVSSILPTLLPCAPLARQEVVCKTVALRCSWVEMVVSVVTGRAARVHSVTFALMRIFHPRPYGSSHGGCTGRCISVCSHTATHKGFGVQQS